jgi:hypothetical protein
MTEVKRDSGTVSAFACHSDNKVCSERSTPWSG